MGNGAEIRKKYILKQIENRGSLLVKDIADQLGISETTVRRDLNELDARGALKQVYGGAVASDNGPPPLIFSISHRSGHQVPGKKRIGRHAAALVNDSDIIYIDPGTTSWEMIPYLKDKKNLTIISNSVRLLQCLEYIGHHNIIQLGGTLRPERLDTVGTLAQLGIEQLRGFTAFQGGDGIDMEFGLSAIDHESALVAKTILSNARKIVVLADHTKFEKPSLLYKITEIEKIDCLVTDTPLSPLWRDRCRQLNITVSVPD